MKTMENLSSAGLLPRHESLRDPCGACAGTPPREPTRSTQRVCRYFFYLGVVSGGGPGGHPGMKTMENLSSAGLLPRHESLRDPCGACAGTPPREPTRSTQRVCRYFFYLGVVSVGFPATRAYEIHAA